MTAEQDPPASTVLALPVSRRTALGALAAGAGAVALGLDLGLDGQDAQAAGAPAILALARGEHDPVKVAS